MKKVKPGDRVWVKTPRAIVERKVGTVVSARKTPKGLRYMVEWEVDLLERPNGHHPGYLAREIVPVS